MTAFNRHWALSVAALCLCPLLASIPTVSAQKEVSLSQSIFSYALALRTAVLAAEDDALRLLATVPGTTALIDLNAPDSESTELIEQLWIPFFRNVVVEIGGEEAQQPTVLYYNPLSDSGLYTRWTATNDGRYQVVRLMAFPGERLGNQGSRVFHLPEWMIADDIVLALADIVDDRRAAFAEFDQSQRRLAETVAGYKSASSDFIAIASRLAQDAVWRERWADLERLPNALERIQQALKEHDPIESLNAVPETAIGVEGTAIGVEHAYDWKLSAQRLEQQWPDGRGFFVGFGDTSGSVGAGVRSGGNDELYKYEEGQDSGSVDEEEIRKRSIADLRSFMDERSSDVGEIQKQREQLDRELMKRKHDTIRDLMRESQRNLSRRSP